jgi:hypothetical protein
MTTKWLLEENKVVSVKFNLGALNQKYMFQTQRLDTTFAIIKLED